VSSTGDNSTRDALERVERALLPTGIAMRGIAAFAEGDGPLLADGRHARSVLLLGNIGGSIWPAFSRWAHIHRGPDPLDRWSKAVIRPLAEDLCARAYFPSDPPWQPFQRWAMMAEGMKASPLGLLIHPQFGLWHGYRGALGFADVLEATAHVAGHPCDACAEKPCLNACPANAVSEAAFDVRACRDYLGEAGQGRCMEEGCEARNACPVGKAYRYPPAQLQFHMRQMTL